MHKHNVSMKLFRLIGTLIAMVLVFSMATGATQAAKITPPVKERLDITPVTLDEVQTYFATRGGLNGNLGVVVEFEDQPAALIFAQSSVSDTSTQTINQVNLIQEKQSTFLQGLTDQGIQATELFRTQKVYNGIWLHVDASNLEKIAAMPDVKAIHPIIPKTLDLTTSVPLIGAPAVWGGVGEYQGEAMTIGIIDTGVDYIHYNFGGTGVYAGQDFTKLTEPGNSFPTPKVVGGWDFAGDDYNADPSSASYNPIPSPDPDPMDCYGHGSHVAGIAAGLGVTADGATYEEDDTDTYAGLMDLTQSEYVAKFRIGPGVAPKALLYSLRVFGCAGSTELTDLAIEWAVDPNNDGDLSDHLDVINMSLGSSFGSEFDTSAEASNNAATAGVIVVASAGNSNDVFYITGSPGVAKNALSVASSVDASSVLGAFAVTANTAPSPLVPLGLYPASLAAFGPQTFNQSGNLAYYTVGDLGCSAYPADTFSGKIALINRGTCNFAVKVKNAQNAGALGVLMVNNTNAFPAPMGGTDPTITIPTMMTSLAVGTSLRTDMAGGTVTVLLSTDNTAIMLDPTIVDTGSTFSSRGPARGETALKPDITAPGDTIFSTKVLSKDQGANMSGTSMAAPHMAGVMALLKEIHPTWTVAELKALAMNTATQDLWYTSAHTLNLTPSRIGAGRVNTSNAALSPVIAFNKEDPAQVNVSFGAQAVLGTQTFVKSITLRNTGVAAALYNVTFDEYYNPNPGLTFTLLDAADNAIANPVTVPAGGSVDIKVQVTADATQLLKSLDPTVVTSTGRQRMSEAGGYVVLTSTAANPELRLPVYIAARPASSMRTVESSLNLPASTTGTVSLTPSGTPVDTLDDNSLVSILELKAIDPNETTSTGINNYADMQYIGVIADYPDFAFSEAAVYFGISTYGKWDTSNAVEFDVYIDVDKDGSDDYVVFNYNQRMFTGTTDDVMITMICDLSASTCGADYYTNGVNGNFNTNLFNNNVIVLPVMATSIGLEDGVDTSFDFHVVSWSRDSGSAVDESTVMSYDLAHPSFGTLSPDTNMPIWYDSPIYSPTFDITYDKTAMSDNQSRGLLLLHHHNAENAAQILTQGIMFLPLIGR
jgi:subtilisin family serine protease